MLKSVCLLCSRFRNQFWGGGHCDHMACTDRDLCADSASDLISVICVCSQDGADTQ